MRKSVVFQFIMGLSEGIIDNDRLRCDVRLMLVVGTAVGEHVLHGEAASAHGERVPAALGLRASARQGAPRPRQLCHLHLH